jgi:hypothetical protein
MLNTSVSNSTALSSLLRLESGLALAESDGEAVDGLDGLGA